ncbi:MAG: hypothetical protein JSS07_07405 [Proteobacteria bacterium]|nr:hypothetical protein [Pseudomonadota bacterium]
MRLHIENGSSKNKKLRSAFGAVITTSKLKNLITQATKKGYRLANFVQDPNDTLKGGVVFRDDEKKEITILIGDRNFVDILYNYVVELCTITMTNVPIPENYTNRDLFAEAYEEYTYTNTYLRAKLILKGIEDNLKTDLKLASLGMAFIVEHQLKINSVEQNWSRANLPNAGILVSHADIHRSRFDQHYSEQYFLKNALRYQIIERQDAQPNQDEIPLSAYATLFNVLETKLDGPLPENISADIEKIFAHVPVLQFKLVEEPPLQQSPSAAATATAATTISAPATATAAATISAPATLQSKSNAVKGPRKRFK